jgi:hypothetical protein
MKLKKILGYFSELLRKQSAYACAATSLIIVLADYLSGTHIQFPIFYIVPIVMASLLNHRVFAYVLAIMLPMIRFCFYNLWHQTEPLFIMAVNTFIRISAFIIIVYLIDIITSKSKRIKILEGILPICASCKRIRNDVGEYEQMEKYITEHSEAIFSHGICPECAKKLYAELRTGRKN